MLLTEIGVPNIFDTPVGAAENALFYDSFDDYTNDAITDVWQTNNAGSVSVDLKGKIKNCLKVTSSNTEMINIAREFGGVLNENRLKIEFYIKGDAQTKLCFTDSGGGDIYVLSWEGKGMSYSQTGANRFAKLDEISLNRMPNEWNKIKLYIDNTTNKYTVVSGSGMAEKSFNASLGSICGVKFITSKALSKNICIDELVITSFENIGTDSAKASFLNGTESSSGAAFIYNDDITDDGLELKCATPDDNGYYSVKSDKGTIKIDLDGDTALNCGNGKNVFIDVKYKDEGYGWFYLRYKTVDGEQANTKEVCLYNSGDTITKKFTLCDAAVNSADNGADLTILTHKFEKDANNANGYDNSCYPVNIYEINIYSDETYSPIDVKVGTNSVGNIFFDNETPSFKIELLNQSANTQSFSVAYSINKYDREMQSQTTDGGENDFTLASGENTLFRITPPQGEYGLYRLDIDVYNSGNIKQETINIPFSRCVKNTDTNKSMGTNVHLSRPDNGDPDKTMCLLKNAGIDSVRDTIDWYRYEKSPGVYKLTNEQEKLLDAAKKYGTDVLLIPLGRNGIYDGMLSKPKLMTKEAAVHYGDFVYNLLKEEKVRSGVNRIEIWNEPDLGISNIDPDKEVDATNVSNGENYKYRAKLYSDMLIEGYKGAARAETELQKDYMIGGFSMQCFWWWSAGRKYMDLTLDNLKKSEDAAQYGNGQFFDVFAIHPYCGKDTENGYEGTYVSNQFDGLAAEIESYKGLITGGDEFVAEGIDKWKPAKGKITGNTYDFTLKDGAWCTEFGLSTAVYPNSVSTGMKNIGTDSNPIYEVQKDRDWLQALKLIRGFDVIKTADFNNRVWFYDFIDDGVRDNEHEYKFGMLNNWDDTVPYSAKYSYLAASAYNKLTEGATKSEMFDDYMKYTDNPDDGKKYSTLTFISKYTAPNRNVYMLRTTKAAPQYISPWEICKGFPTNINNLKFYDMLGNRIDSAQIVSGNKYKVTREPYYVVDGEDIDLPQNSGTPKIYFIKDSDTDKVYESISPSEINISSFKFMIDFGDKTEPDDYRVIVALYDSDRLVQMLYKYKYNGVSKEGNKKVFSVNGLVCGSDYDRIKIMAIENLSNIKPIARAFESIREE
jgi:hypothetical protein